MNFYFLEADASAANPGGGMGSMMIMIVLMFVIIYFFMIRPQKKRQKEIQNFRNSIQVGTKVVTAGGIYGTVKDLNAGMSYLTLEIANGVKIQIDRNYVYADPSQAATTQQQA